MPASDANNPYRPPTSDVDTDKLRDRTSQELRAEAKRVLPLLYGAALAQLAAYLTKQYLALEAIQIVAVLAIGVAGLLLASYVTWTLMLGAKKSAEYSAVAAALALLPGVSLVILLAAWGVARALLRRADPGLSGGDGEA